MSTPIVIRDLREDETHKLLVLGKTMHAEGAFRVAPLSEEKVLDIFTRATYRDDFLCVVAELKGEFVGYFLAVISADWFSEEKTAKEIALYVTPEYRRQSVASDLIDVFLEWAKKQKAAEANAGSSSGISNEGVRRLYESKGFHGVGFNLEKRI